MVSQGSADDPEEKEGFKAKYGYDLQPAQNWEQYRDLAEWFTRPEEGLYGTALQGKRHEALWYEWLNFLYSFGGDMMEVQSGSECGPIIVNSPQAVASLEYYKSLMQYSPPDTLNYFWDDVMALMQQARVFELIMWNDATYAVSEDAEASRVAGKMGFDLIPQGEGGKVGQVEGWTYLIPTYSKNQEAAFLFIQWMMEHEQQLEQHLNGGASARPDVYADPEVQKLAYAKASMDTNEVAIPKPTIPESPQITDILVRELSSYPRRRQVGAGGARHRRARDARPARRLRAHAVPGAVGAGQRAAVAPRCRRLGAIDTLALTLSDGDGDRGGAPLRTTELDQSAWMPGRAARQCAPRTRRARRRRRAPVPAFRR